MTPLRIEIAEMLGAHPASFSGKLIEELCRNPVGQLSWQGERPQQLHPIGNSVEIDGVRQQRWRPQPCECRHRRAFANLEKSIEADFLAFRQAIGERPVCNPDAAPDGHMDDGFQGSPRRQKDYIFAAPLPAPYPPVRRRGVGSGRPVSTLMSVDENGRAFSRSRSMARCFRRVCGCSKYL